MCIAPHLRSRRWEDRVSPQRMLACSDNIYNANTMDDPVAGADLESLTEKACSPRRYEAFVAMLLAALRRTSGSVSLDILSFSDLEAMRGGSGSGSGSGGRNGGGFGQGSAGGRQPPAAPNSKRYLILTHVSDFERVHYPLPLCLEEAALAAARQQEAAQQTFRHSPTAAERQPRAGTVSEEQLGDLLAQISHLRKVETYHYLIAFAQPL